MPESREPVAYLCAHAPEPATLRVGYQCDGDEPVYEGDTVVTEAVIRTQKVDGVVRTYQTVTARVVRQAEAPPNPGVASKHGSPRPAPTPPERTTDGQ